MNIPALTGIIRRRILLNYRVAPDVIQEVLPAKFRPKLVSEHAIAGICLIRLEKIYPKGLPLGIISLTSENSAHRIAVEWNDDHGELREGVFVPRRDTDSRVNSLAGGRLFPAIHHYSKFNVKDHDGVISVQVVARDGENPLVDLQVSESELFPETSIFNSLKESSKFFEAGYIGYSSRPNSCKLDGLRLKVPRWQASPLIIDRASSAYFNDTSIFPSESIKLDHALLMRDIHHEWHPEPSIVTT